jgi:hypothetical protein
MMMLRGLIFSGVVMAQSNSFHLLNATQFRVFAGDSEQYQTAMEKLYFDLLLLIF